MESNGRSVSADSNREVEAPAQDQMKLPPLFYKNLYRAARALHYDNADSNKVINALQELLEISIEEDAGEYRNMAAKLKEQLNYYLQMPPKNDMFQPSLLRASFQNPYVEYYPFGMCDSFQHEKFFSS
jgi:hypothetical protein